ncbi:MAG: radical SAM protein [Actinomycetota bacterium]|nr:radical SAM protein [Actinomycetota bacterium]
MKKKILMVYPKYDETFWSFKKVLKIINKESAFPPLGLLTVSAMLPADWEKKILDLNFENLTEQDILWADYVFISAMIVQKLSTDQVIQKVQQLGKPVVAGGPMFTTGWENYSHVDHLFIGESEHTIKDFIEDVRQGKVKDRYESDSFPDIETSPIPDWEQIDITKYNSLCIQFSRGCPFNCEFCDIVKLNGRVPRTKSSQQIIDELDTIYAKGYRGGIFFVDDNFIGNKGKLKREHLPAIIQWQRKRKFPFAFNTQVSINLADDQELMQLMSDAGFTAVFVGIETPDPAGLAECSKYQNQNRDLIESVQTLQKEGFEVQGGFIVGFDSDTPSIFQS